MKPRLNETPQKRGGKEAGAKKGKEEWKEGKRGGTKRKEGREKKQRKQTVVS